MADNKNIVYKIHVDDSGSIATVRKLDGTIVATKLDVQALRKEFGNFAVSTKQATTIAAKDFDRFGKSVKSAKTDMHGVSAATGSASASVLEMGRAISDSNYGIRGMANNLSQLASNMVYTTKAAGGVLAGLKQIGKALLGPLGIILLIQAAIAYFEKLSMATELAADSLDAFESKSVTDASAKLMILRDALNSTTSSLEAKNRMIRKASEEYPELNLQLDENNKLTKDSVTLLDAQIDALMRNAKAKAIAEKATEAYKKLISEQVKTEAESLNWYNTIYQATKFRIQGEKALAGAVEQGAKDRQKAIDKAQEELDKYTKLLTQEEENGSTLLELLFGKDSKGKGSRALKVFKSKVLDLYTQFNSLRAEQRKLAEREEKDLLLIQQEAELKSLQQKYNKYKRERKIDLDAYLLRIKDLSNFEELKAKAQSIYDSDIGEARHNFYATQQKMLSKNNLELERLNEEHRDKERQAEFATRQNSIKNILTVYDEQKIAQSEAMLDLEEARIRQQEEITARFDEGSHERFLAEQELSQMRMDLQSQELNHELLILDAKQRANQEYINWVSGLSGILRDVAGENEAIAKIGLVLEKGAAIAGILVENAKSNAQVVLSAQAEKAGWMAKAAASLNPASTAAFMALSVKAGVDEKKRLLKNNITAGVSIASILATTLQSRSVSSSGGAGGDSQGRSFDFNLVGSTGQNQLAQAVGSQIQQPIRAYVVSSEITNQQQFDNQIQGTATIGDD